MFTSFIVIVLYSGIQISTEILSNYYVLKLIRTEYYCKTVFFNLMFNMKDMIE